MSHPPIGAPSPALVAALGLAQCVYRERLGSTMDEAHALAREGAPAGTLVLASMQEVGRGRGGRVWTSEPDAGLWATLVERPQEAAALEVLSLRIGLALADALQPLVDGPIGLKWPNDLLVHGRKLAGILIEARWREARPDWVAIGVGINRRVPSGFPDAACVHETVTRDALLEAVVPAMRRAAAATGMLTPVELDDWRARDVALGRRLREPLAGTAEGITPDGQLRVRDDAGTEQRVRSGSLRLA